MKRHELAGKRKRVFAAVLSAAVMMSSIAPGVTAYAEDVIIEEEPGAESGMIETYGAEDGMGVAAGYDDINGAGSSVSDAAVPSGEAGSTSGAVIEEGTNADGINASENPSADDDLAMQIIDGFVTAIEEVEEPKGLATSILQSRIDALPTPEEFFAMTEGEMAEGSTLTQQQMDIYTEVQAIADEYEALSEEEQAQVDISRLEALMEAVNEMAVVTVEEAGEILELGGSAKIIDSSGDKTYTIKMDNATSPLTQSALTITAESGNIILNIAENLSINSSAPLIDIRAGEGCTVTIQGNGHTIENSNEKNDGEDAREVVGIIQVAPKNGNSGRGAKVVLNSGIYKAKTGINIKNISGDLEINNAHIVGGYYGIENGTVMGVNEGTDVTINGGEVRDCDSGGILNRSGSKMTIHAVKIYGNGGDGGIVNWGILNLWQEAGHNIPDSDCIIQITENKSFHWGNGILVQDGTVSMRGKIEIVGNYNDSDEADLGIYRAWASPIEIVGSLEGSNINFMVFGTDNSGPEPYTGSVAGCLTKDYQKYNPDTAWDAYFHLKTSREDLAQGWYTDSSGNKEVGALNHTHSWAYAQSEGTKNQTLGYLYCDNEESHCAYYGTGTNYPKENYVTLTFDGLDAENRMVYSGNAYNGASVTYKIADAIEEKVLGENKPAPEISYYTGANYTEPVTSPTNAGKYKAVVTIGETKVLEKIFTILPKELTVTANDAKKDSGKADPKLTYRADGLAASDTLNGITIRRQAGEAVGTYTITVSQPAGANPNYAITFRGATFTIEPADQSGLKGKAIYNLKLPMFLAKGSGRNKKITLSWLKYKWADGYEVYWSYCDGTQGFKKLGTFKKSTLSATHKKLNNKKEYKYYVAAYKMVNGKKIYIARSNALHVAMKNAKKTNAKSITVNKTKVTLREGKTFKLKCKVKKAGSRKKLLLHTDKFRYHTSDSSIATVSKSGKIKALKKGTCTIYIFANNGVYKSVKVTVKK